MLLVTTKKVFKKKTKIHHVTFVVSEIQFDAAQTGQTPPLKQPNCIRTRRSESFDENDGLVLCQNAVLIKCHCGGSYSFNH